MKGIVLASLGFPPQQHLIMVNLCDLNLHLSKVVQRNDSICSIFLFPGLLFMWILISSLKWKKSV